MIPDREDQCSASRTPSVPISTFASGPSDKEQCRRQKQHNSPAEQPIQPQQQQNNQLQQQQLQPGETAWSRYWQFAESMKSRGQIFDRKLLLEAMFRGNDLVYSTS